MKVIDLFNVVKELVRTSPEHIIVLSSDEEGNSYSPLRGIETNVMYNDGEIGLESLTEDLKEQGYSEEDVMIDGKKAIILSP